MMVMCAIPLPLGYDAVSMAWTHAVPSPEAAAEGFRILRVIWTTPSGRPIYASAAAKEADIRTDEFWQKMLDHVVQYVRGNRTGTQTGELNEPRIPTIIEPDATIAPRMDSEPSGERASS